MILFVGPYPSRENEKDGLVQRVRMVDAMFGSYTRVYLDISLFHNLRFRVSQPAPLVTLYRLNAFVHLPVILRQLKRSKSIYVHSIHFGLRCFSAYLGRQTITDMHGAVPEEMAFEGLNAASVVFRLIEASAVRRSRAIITVTHAMARHLRAKYPGLALLTYTIPYLDCNSSVIARTRNSRDKYTVIYAGGTQVWQNIDTMLRSMKTSECPCNYLMISQDTGTLQSKLRRYGLADDVRVMSVDRRCIGDYYRQADLGFVLREDNTVNRVACPTKLVEYMTHGVVPIVIQPQIGDFVDYGFSYVALEDFINGHLPTGDELESMRSNNYAVLERIKADSLVEVRNMMREMVGDERA